MNNNNNKKGPRKAGKIFPLNIFWMYGLIALVLGGIYLMNENTVTKEVDWTEFQKAVEERGVTKIIVYSNKNKAEGFLTDSAAQKIFRNSDFNAAESKGATITTGIPSAEAVSNAYKQWKDSGVFTGNIDYKQSSDYSSLLWTFGPVVLLIAFWFFIMKKMSNREGGGGGVFSVGKAKAQLFDKDNANKVTFKDVAGLSEAKTEVEEIVEFLKNPQSYTELGGRIPKGALLVGGRSIACSRLVPSSQRESTMYSIYR